jgi:hypothetical protein
MLYCQTARKILRFFALLTLQRYINSYINRMQYTTRALWKQEEAKRTWNRHNFVRTYINRTNYFTTSHHLFTHSLFHFRVNSSLSPGIIRNCLICASSKVREREKQFSQFAHPLLILMK